MQLAQSRPTLKSMSQQVSMVPIVHAELPFQATLRASHSVHCAQLKCNLLYCLLLLVSGPLQGVYSVVCCCLFLVHCRVFTVLFVVVCFWSIAGCLQCCLLLLVSGPLQGVYSVVCCCLSQVHCRMFTVLFVSGPLQDVYSVVCCCLFLVHCRVFRSAVEESKSNFSQMFANEADIFF